MIKSIKRFWISMHLSYISLIIVSFMQLYYDYSYNNIDPELGLSLSILLLAVSIISLVTLIISIVFQVVWTYKLAKELNQNNNAQLTLWHGTWAWFIPFVNLYLPIQLIHKTNKNMLNGIKGKKVIDLNKINRLFSIWFYCSIGLNIASLVYLRIAQENTTPLLITNIICIILSGITYFYGIKAIQEQYQLTNLFLASKKITK